MPSEHVISSMPGSGSRSAGTGHNGWHESVQPVLEVAPGDTVVFETRDAFDGQLGPGSPADIAGLDLEPVHPLTGPVFVKEQSPVTCSRPSSSRSSPIPRDQWGYTVEVPGFGFLRDEFPDPYIVHWRLNGRDARSPRSCRACGSPAARSRARSGWRRAASCGRALPSARPSWPSAAGSRSRLTTRRRPRQRAGSGRGAAHHAAARDRRQYRHKAVDPGGKAAGARVGRGRPRVYR